MTHAQQDCTIFFQGKKITQMGLGLLGRGVQDAQFMLSHGAILTITDLKTAEQLASSIAKLEPWSDQITYVLGEHRHEDFENCDLVLKAAGVPLDSPYLKTAESHGIPIEMDESLFAHLAPDDIMIIGVTGTRGKSTVTNMVFRILKETDRRVHLAGNVRGVATLPLLDAISPDEIVVLELSSWQLQGFARAHLSPHIAVFTNLLDDHMNYYQGDMDAYYNDKAAIFRHQGPTDHLILSEQIAPRVIPEQPRSQTQIVTADALPIDWELQLIGSHNRANAGLALAVARILDIPDDLSRRVLSELEPVEGRLQFVNELSGIKIYNDNNATSVDALQVALETLGDPRHLVLIMGGADKDYDLDPIIATLKNSVKHIVLLPGSGSDRLRPMLSDAGIHHHDVASMQAAVEAAWNLAERDDTIILSPLFASFGLFQNEYDRNDQFIRAVAFLRPHDDQVC